MYDRRDRHLVRVNAIYYSITIFEDLPNLFDSELRNFTTYIWEF